MSMTCCSTFISGFAAVVAMLAFIFDLVLFFVAKSRINAVGSAQIGNAIWLTLAAWLLLFFSGCFYALGRCCISNRPRAPSGNKNSYSGGKWASRDPEQGPDGNEQLRLDAVKAEADRKARQKQGEVGLPAFSETQPLTARVDGDQVYVDRDDDHANSSNAHLTANAVPPARQQGYAGGYVQAAPGTRAVDEYYSPTPAQAGNTYPPQHPSRQGSGYAPATPSVSGFSNVSHSPVPQQSTAYGASPYGTYNAPSTTSPPPSNQLLGVPGQYNPGQYGQEYGHTAGGSSCE